jgi:hypothetical protein
VNNSSEVVGLANDAAWNYKPFIWDATNGMRALNVHPSYPTNEWYAAAINDSSVIGGHVIATTNQHLPAYWTTPTADATIITMPEGFPYGEIYGLNNQGQFVGLMWVSDAEDAQEGGFVFDVVNGARNLTDLIDPALGVTITSAVGINDNGYIAAAGDRDGQRFGYRLIPIKTPSSPLNLNQRSGGLRLSVR